MCDLTKNFLFINTQKKFWASTKAGAPGLLGIHCLFHTVDSVCKMHYFQLIFALLASSSLVTAAAPLRINRNGLCRFELPHRQRLGRFVRESDNPDALAQMTGECMNVDYDHFLHPLLEDMVRLNRRAMLAFIIPRLWFNHLGIQRDELLSILLGLALRNNKILLANDLLDQGFQIDLDKSVTFWWNRQGPSVPWNLDELRLLVDSHVDQAEYLSPSHGAMGAAETPGNMAILVELAHYCGAVSGKHVFDPTKFFREILNRKYFCDEDMAQLVARLLEFGMESGQEILDILRERHPYHEQTYNVIENWNKPEVKDPGFE